MSTLPDPGALLATDRTALTPGAVRRHPAALTGSALLTGLALLACCGPLFYPWDHTALDPLALRRPPSGSHWFGTDGAGADVFAQVLRGTRRSLVVGVLTAILGTTVAVVIGTAAGYHGGRLDRVVLSCIGLFLVLPGFLLVAAVSPVIEETSWLLLVVFLTAFSWMITARVVRDSTRSLRERDFVRAARYLGVPGRTVIRRHAVPSLASFLIIDATLQAGSAVIAEAGLAYLGFGARPPEVSLGAVIATGTPNAMAYPWLFYFPVCCLLLLCLSLFLIGDGLRDALDPTSAGTKRRRGTSAGTRHRRDAPAGGTPVAGGRLRAEPPTPSDPPVLEVRDLHVSLPSPGGTVHAVRGVSLQVRPGEVLAVVGESGAGKSVTASAILGLLPEQADVRGSVLLNGQDLTALGEAGLCRIRGKELSIVFQDSHSSLTPVYSVGFQLAEALRVHKRLTRTAARQRAVQLLGLVGIADPARRIDAYPHELSGGMRQRVAVAMAIAHGPSVIVADEPTTALDVTAQAQILDLLGRARTATGAAVVIITHDLAVVAGLADRIHVMYAGRFVEEGPVDDVYERPRMPYTIGLLGAVPRPETRHRILTPIEGSPPSPLRTPRGCPFVPRCPLAFDACGEEEPVLEVRDGVGHATACLRSAEFEQKHGPALTAALSTPSGPSVPSVYAPPPPRVERPVVLRMRRVSRHYPARRTSSGRAGAGPVRAVDDVSLDIREGETLVLVGESGSGKTTLLRQVVEAPPQRGHAAGTVLVAGRDIRGASPGERRLLCREVQMVFQDPVAALDPRMTVADILTEPLATHGWTRDASTRRAADLLNLVGLGAEHRDRFPAQLSGGQAQRVGIARALALRPRLLLLDEPVSALDVSAQAAVLNLLRRLRAELGLSCLLVAHDLAVAGYLADRVAVMHLGRVVETGDADTVLTRPGHPYTQVLLSAAPRPEPRLERNRPRLPLLGEPLGPMDIPTGCRFRGRCPRYAELPSEQRRRCESEDPLPSVQAAEHTVACHFAGPHEARDGDPPQPWPSSQ
ncbi:dipeptide ABC transporter ATP-binding protein [Streptomyces alboniger]|uniref:Dipeptide ABC transporter ATP-binding protein n=1 Tax=Streptomyces alboniger TaxID=132473 RepID=A0A5J6HRK4_STRAD|nr:dipeptide ABC transporter ATP-binding protein [Streptomyces alboniger]QEV20900.1 dipeptide ABC transporter ATP-binding protein [Streptomyces alboniger]